MNDGDSDVRWIHKQHRQATGHATCETRAGCSASSKLAGRKARTRPCVGCVRFSIVLDVIETILRPRALTDLDERNKRKSVPHNWLSADRSHQAGDYPIGNGGRDMVTTFGQGPNLSGSLSLSERCRAERCQNGQVSVTEQVWELHKPG